MAAMQVKWPSTAGAARLSLPGLRRVFTGRLRWTSLHRPRLPSLRSAMNGGVKNHPPSGGGSSSSRRTARLPSQHCLATEEMNAKEPLSHLRRAVTVFRPNIPTVVPAKLRSNHWSLATDEYGGAGRATTCRHAHCTVHSSRCGGGAVRRRRVRVNRTLLMKLSGVLAIIQPVSDVLPRDTISVS